MMWCALIAFMFFGSADAYATPSQPDRPLAQMGVRLSDMETDIQRVEGKQEETQHGLQELLDQRERQNADFEMRFKALEESIEALRASLAVKRSEKSKENSKTSPSKKVSAPQSSPSSEIASDDVPEHTLNDQLNAQQTEGAQPQKIHPPAPSTSSSPKKEATKKEPSELSVSLDENVPSKKTPQGLFKEAKAAFEQSDYDKAAELFKKFIKNYPKDKNISLAKYYLGSILYVQEDFTQASLTLVQAYKADPKGSKAPECLLKLALSLKNLSKKEEACKTLNKLAQSFPKMNLPVKKQADQLRHKLHCAAVPNPE